MRQQPTLTFVAITASFRVFYVCVVLAIGTRRIGLRERYFRR